MKDLFAAGNYRPGDRIPTELELSQLFGVGRSSIREAIKVFEHLGVLEAKAAKGTFVRDRANISAEAISWAVLLGNDDLRDVFHLRRVIEQSCFERLMHGYSEGDRSAEATVSALEEVVERMRRGAEGGDVDTVVEADYEFHRLVIDAGENRLFSEVYRTLHSFMRLEIQESHKGMPSLADAAEDHADMARAIRSLPPEGAISRHSAHFDRIQSLLALEPEE
jgi:DNA-binding FadR family transcriptional regulator